MRDWVQSLSISNEKIVLHSVLATNSESIEVKLLL